MKKQLSIMVSICLVAVMIVLPTITRAQALTDAPAIEKTRADIQKLATAPDKKVEVKLRDATKFKGYIAAVDQDSFMLKDSKTGANERISYAEVVSVKRSSGGVSTKTWLILGAAAAGAIVTSIVVKPAVCDGGAQSRGLC